MGALIVLYCYRNVRSYNFPLDSDTLDNLSKKKFSEETNKKVRWVRKMFSEWRSDRNASGMEFIECDLEDICPITEDNFIFGMK